jgi:DNA-binding LytR/AlgR family response regulator
MMKLKAIAVDDELPALKVMENFCAKNEQVELCKTFNKPNEAIKYLKKFPVDLIFLDINMPEINGIELASVIHQNTKIVFTTAHSEYAVEGFNLNAVDYLLKPFTIQRFNQAITKVKMLLQNITTDENNENNHFFIRADYSLIKINFDEILFVEGLDDYLKIHLQHQKPIVARMTMKAMNEKLPTQKFVRVHRSYIVALNKIEKLRNKNIFINNVEIPIGSMFEEHFYSAYVH